MVPPVPDWKVEAEAPVVPPTVVVNTLVDALPSAKVVSPVPPAFTVVVAALPILLTIDCKVVIPAAPVLPTRVVPVEALPMVMVPEVVPGVKLKLPVVPVTAMVMPPVPD